MPGSRLSFLASAVLVACLAAGCTPSSRTTSSITASSQRPAAHAAAPEPRDPDLAGVMERFYQQVEGAHWSIAEGMLSPKLRASLGENGLRGRYARFADLDVTLRESAPRTVVASLGAVRRDDGAKLRVEETARLRWDGEDWQIDALERR